LGGVRGECDSGPTGQCMPPPVTHTHAHLFCSAMVRESSLQNVSRLEQSVSTCILLPACSCLLTVSHNQVVQPTTSLSHANQAPVSLPSSNSSIGVPQPARAAVSTKVVAIQTRMLTTK
jgi:hypothetical protein